MKTLQYLLLCWAAGVFYACSGREAPAKQGVWEANDPIAPAPQQVSTDSLTDPRDGNTYATVTIGKQTWMAENLRYDTTGTWQNPAYPSPTYGRLYHGQTAQSACPKGWHLPTDTEWNALEMTLGMSPADTVTMGWRGKHGSALKSAQGWIDQGNGSNDAGFKVLPTGYYHEGDFDNSLGASAGFWSATEGAGTGVWVRFLGAPLPGVNRFYEEDLSGNRGLACRCVRDTLR